MSALSTDERGIRIHKPSCEAKVPRSFFRPYFPLRPRASTEHIHVHAEKSENSCFY